MSREKLELAAAIVELRSTYGENQQRFSDRLGVAMATLGRWEIDSRRPSPRYLKELWHLASEQDKPDLAQIFADAFALAAGYALSAGEAGFDVRRLVANIRRDAMDALTGNDLTPVKNILRDVEELYQHLRTLDLEPPFRSIVRVTKGKK
jgi:hypothetical protein